MKLEIWSDVVCPWCYIGKARLAAALRAFEHADKVEVIWRSYELDPAFPKGKAEPKVAAAAEKYGMSAEQVMVQSRTPRIAEAEGLPYDLERVISVNTFDAHRLLQYAATRDLAPEANDRLMRAHFAEGRTLDIATLLELAEDVGLSSEEVRQVLDGDAFTDEVRADVERAAAYGITSVPFIVVDEKYGIAGAHDPETLLAALHQAHAAASTAEDRAGR